MRRRDFICRVGLGAAVLTCGINTIATPTAGALKGTNTQLRVAASRFETNADVGQYTDGLTGARVETIAGSLKTTVILIEDSGERVCLVSSCFYTDSLNVAVELRKSISQVLGLDQSRILLFSSHNHSTPLLTEGQIYNWDWYGKSPDELPEVKWLPIGERFMASLRENLSRLPDALEPATVWWTEGSEGRITYNRKGRRADGSTYFMREEDRKLVGKDFNGDIDREVPVVVFKGQNGRPVAALLQFTGHPVTSYHPEKFTVFGDYPQVASDWLGQALGQGGPVVPVAFLQGCAGDINSKEMFEGGVARAREFGEMLGQSAVDALADLRPSRRHRMDYAEQFVSIPLAPLPSRETLLAELEEMEDFIRRADAGDPDTLSCVGLNFPRALSPKYRGALIKAPLSWNQWALNLYAQGRENTVMRSLDVPVNLLRLGDAGIVGMPFEPFLGIGRQMRAKSPFPLTIPCGYVNGTHGYVTDSANTGDREYMSAFYRYTPSRPPFARPAGDVVADRAVEILKNFTEA